MIHLQRHLRLSAHCRDGIRGCVRPRESSSTSLATIGTLQRRNTWMCTDLVNHLQRHLRLSAHCRDGIRGRLRSRDSSLASLANTSQLSATILQR
ncbi:unnamed protein product [Onchocerca flexuosa]|uniref:Secreted protein n=1 Tax=Onchocerca flexuosa TaxID=387005 RepID=A0A183HQY5_9BILA|nr:unnamed protein product [Onchocerca flexuosa]